MIDDEIVHNAVQYYLAPNISNETGLINQTLPTKEYHGNIYTGNYLDSLPEPVFKNYVCAIRDRLNQYGLKVTVLCRLGDISTQGNNYSFTKTRLAEKTNNKYTLLKCFNQPRHWGIPYENLDDIKFKDKINKVVWRGSTTGHPPGEHLHRGGDRFTCVEKYFHENVFTDIGFSETCQDREDYSQYVKKPMTQHEIRTYKYILSIEGNDKDSGINWKLKSNSVVLMPKPTIVSWLMEDELIDKHHYVQVRGDYSDLESKIAWCEENQDHCLEIINNAHKYMKRFENVEQEMEIEKQVIQEHLKRVNYIK